jgi:hypothetical protein
MRIGTTEADLKSLVQNSGGAAARPRLISRVESRLSFEWPRRKKRPLRTVWARRIEPPVCDLAPPHRA